jgi:hypothetical protein
VGGKTGRSADSLFEPGGKRSLLPLLTANIKSKMRPPILNIYTCSLKNGCSSDVFFDESLSEKIYWGKDVCWELLQYK